MTIMYCELCERPVEARRRIGGWTYFWGFMSVGLSLLAVPFYRKRCPICRSRAVSRIAPEDLPELRIRRRAELERRLAFAEDELDVTSEELDRVRAELDFYRDLTDGRGEGRPVR